MVKTMNSIWDTSCDTCICNDCKMNEVKGIYGGCLDCEDCEDGDMYCDEAKHVVYKKSGRAYKSVNQYDTDMNLIKTWNSITEAENKTNINRSNIIAVCNNKQKTAGGFIWRYNNDSNK